FYNRPMGNAEYDVIRIPPNGYYTEINAYDGQNLGPVGLTYNTVPLVNPLTRLGRIGVDTINPNSIDYPRTVTASMSLARRLPWQNVLEVSYVGTFGRHLLNRSQDNIIPDGRLLTGRLGNADLSDPLQRAALSGDAVNSLRPFPALSYVRWWEYKGISNYHSLQATLSRQTGRRFQYFVAYTFSKVLGSVFQNGEYGDLDPFDPRHRSYGTLSYDRTHILNLSYNYSIPDAVKGGVAGGILNGWQISGISTFASGVPISLGFDGDIANAGIPWFGTPDHIPFQIQGTNRASVITPVFTCDPRKGMGGSNVGDKILNVNCIGIPAFGQSGAFTSPYYIRLPTRMNHDITLFKNFAMGEKSSRKLQFRVGLFNIFNQAVPSAGIAGDVDLRLQTACNVHVNGVPNGAGGTSDNVCDPTKGYTLTDNSKANFGKVILKRGHRVVEFALKLYF
ncbi:MAG TPA: hypothetical protein VK132_04780, partial [Gemmatimonadales bacterium]|nr:hypothetical protein [Gemmatimonadales bacterium]